MHQGALGDLILSLPAFYAIRKKYSKARFEAMGYPHVLSLIHNRFYADAIVSIDRAGVASLYHDDGCLDEELANYLRQFEKIIIFGGKSQAVVINNIRQITSGSEVCLIKTFPESQDVHVTDFQLNQLTMRGFENARTVPEIFLRAEDISNAQNYLLQQGIDIKNNRLIAVHAGSGSKTKNWPLENYSVLVKNIYEKFRATIMLVAGPAEDTIITVLRELLNGIPLTGLHCLELPLLAAILSRCNLYIGNDSGITHLAAAAGVRAIALFGPTDSNVWGPRGKRVYIARERAEATTGWKWVSTDAVLKTALDFLTTTTAN